jgi:hypothetical protein
MPHQQAGYMRAILSLSFAALDLAEREETIYGLNSVKPNTLPISGFRPLGFAGSAHTYPAGTADHPMKNSVYRYRPPRQAMPSVLTQVSLSPCCSR